MCQIHVYDDIWAADHYSQAGDVPSEVVYQLWIKPLFSSPTERNIPNFGQAKIRDASCLIFWVKKGRNEVLHFILYGKTAIGLIDKSQQEDDADHELSGLVQGGPVSK
jgi:hypothetical protein